MLARQIFVVVIAAALLCAQTTDIFSRVRHMFAESGEGDVAASDLAKKNYDHVQKMLAGVHAVGDPARVELLAVEGAVAFLAAKPKDSAEYFEKAAALGPLSDTDSFTRAMALVNLGEENRAVLVLTELAAKHPDQALYVYWLGKIDYGQRRYLEAITKLKRALALDPNSVRAWNSLGLAFDMQGESEEALRALQKAAKLNEEQPHPSPWPPHDLGFLLLRMERFEEAEIALRESLHYEPALAQSHYHLGRVLEKQGRDAEAIREYETAVADDPASSDACYSLALLYRKEHHNREADAMFTQYKQRRQAAFSPSPNQ